MFWGNSLDFLQNFTTNHTNLTNGIQDSGIDSCENSEEGQEVCLCSPSTKQSAGDGQAEELAEIFHHKVEEVTQSLYGRVCCGGIFAGTTCPAIMVLLYI
jgi:hypothetical protein